MVSVSHWGKGMAAGRAVLAVVVGAHLAGTVAHAAAQEIPGPTCVAQQARLAGRFEQCVLDAHAAARERGAAPVLAGCDHALADAWQRLRRCPPGDVPTTLLALITQHAAFLAAAVSGAPLRDCPARVDDCEADLTVCLAECSPPTTGTLLATGQVSCWNGDGTLIPCAGSGQDGALQSGIHRLYVDHGNGTITESGTGLMWEKLGDDGSVHDRDATYTWNEAFAKVALLNGSAFGGHTDWRLPNVVELDSLVSYARVNPTIAVPFIFPDCLPGCSPLTCGCTRAAEYWTSTTSERASSQDSAWTIGFFDGTWQAVVKAAGRHVRVVRGGAATP